MCENEEVPSVARIPQLEAELARMQKRLTEQEMVGIRFRGRFQYYPKLMVRIDAGWKEYSKEEKRLLPTIEFSQIANQKWVGNLVELLKEKYRSDVLEADKRGINSIVEVGTLHTQEAYSDNTWIVVRSHDEWLTEYIANKIKEVHPVGGGGVPGSHYRGNPTLMSDGEGKHVLFYNQSSYGIGD